MISLKGKKVLVTGAGGFIGSHLCERLVEKGAKVKAMVLYNSDSKIDNLVYTEIQDKIDIFFGDIRDISSVESAMKDIDIVFHLAALISIPYSYENPYGYVNTNIIGTLNILEVARKNKTEKIIITSTSETYGTAKYAPIDEEHPMQGQSPYSATKIGADKIAESYYKSFAMPIAIVRPFNTYGPRQSARAIIPTIITQALKYEFVKLGNLEPTRDLTFVKDTVEGFIKIAENDASIGKTLNIGNGNEISIGELAKKIITIIEKIQNKKIKLVSEKERVRPKNSEVGRLICSNKLAKKVIGWEPKYTLDEGLNKTISFISENINDYSMVGKYLR